MDTDLMTAPGILARLRLLLDTHRRPSRNTLTELCDQIEQQLADAAAEEASHWARLEAARRRVSALTGELHSITDVALHTVAQVLAADSSDYVEPDQAAPAGLARPLPQLIDLAPIAASSVPRLDDCAECGAVQALWTGDRFLCPSCRQVAQ